MVNCVVAGCKSRPDRKGEQSLRFYTFPKDDTIREQWVLACGKRKPFKVDVARICSQHFSQSDIKLQDILLKVPEHKRRLKNGAVPSKNLPISQRLSSEEKKRKKLENKALVEESIAAYERNQNRLRVTDGDAIYGIQLNGKTGKGVLTAYARYDYGCVKELHIIRLEAENRKLKTLIRKQAMRAKENETLRCSLSGIMTKGQVTRLIHPGKKLKWNAEDIASAMSLYTAGPNAYALLRKRNFPLPASSTLRDRAGKIELKPGILNSVLQLMRKLDYEEKDRLCVLCFNKIRLKATSYPDKSTNVSLTRAKWAYVVLARGLFKDWIHIVYYDLDVPMSADILKTIIEKLEGVRYVVTAVISDMGPTIAALWDELGVSENQPFFRHPCDELRKVFFFVDVRHLIKLIRSRFIGTGFILNGKPIDVGPVKEIIHLDNRAFKISHEHVDVTKPALRKLNLATELLSDSVSAEVKKRALLGEIQSSTALECADFIKVVSDWFKVFNSTYTSVRWKVGMKPFGVTLELQNHTLTAMSERIENLKATKRPTVLCFQSGVLLNNAALPQMLNYITQLYNITYIETTALNHEELDKLFNIIRFKGGENDNPTPLEFKYRLRSILLGKMVL